MLFCIPSRSATPVLNMAAMAVYVRFCPVISFWFSSTAAVMSALSFATCSAVCSIAAQCVAASAACFSTFASSSASSGVTYTQLKGSLYASHKHNHYQPSPVPVLMLWGVSASFPLAQVWVLLTEGGHPSLLTQRCPTQYT